jgi:hypothetical protein
MSNATTARRRRVPPIVPAVVPPIVAAVVQPLARRLSRIEALLMEMRFEQDVQLKRVTLLREQLDALSERVLQSSQRPTNRKRRV